MTVLERIKEETRAKKNYGLTKLESELGYGNGSLSKAKNIPAYRINEIAEFLGVSVDYLMTGKEIKHEIYNEESAHLVGKIRRNKELTDALLKYFELPEKKQKLVLELINTLSEE